jgi:hypothetical protein
MRKAPETLVSGLGLSFRSTFINDRQFYLALAAAPLVLLLLTWTAPDWSDGIRMSMPLVFSMVLWQPLIEELLFRGLVQGQLADSHWARMEMAGLSMANVITSLLFVVAHFIHHTPLWAGAVFVPSLIFGYFRDRHRQIYPSFILHAAYNGFYLLIGSAGIAASTY